MYEGITLENDPIHYLTLSKNLFQQKFLAKHWFSHFAIIFNEPDSKNYSSLSYRRLISHGGYHTMCFNSMDCLTSEARRTLGRLKGRAAGFLQCSHRLARTRSPPAHRVNYNTTCDTNTDASCKVVKKCSTVVCNSDKINRIFSNLEKLCDLYQSFVENWTFLR